MSQYFRVHAFYAKENLEIAIDSNGKYTALWQFSAFLMSKGFEIIKPVKDSGFDNETIPKADIQSEKLILVYAKRRSP